MSETAKTALATWIVAVEASCPRCKRLNIYKVSDIFDGKVVDCANCHYRFALEQQEEI